MSLVGLELSDVGIIAVVNNPPELLSVDGKWKESPAFATPEKKRLLVGKAAQNKARFFRGQVATEFWDQLNLAPLKVDLPMAQHHAEIAFTHLSKVWTAIADQCDQLVVAIPDYFEKQGLGLVAAIAKELNLPVKKFVSLSLASVQPVKDSFLLHLDLHLHRATLAYLRQGDYLIREDALTTTSGLGLNELFDKWAIAIAKELIHATGYDPFHCMASEQSLYDQLPTILETLKEQAAIVFEMKGGGDRTYQVALTRELFLEQCEPLLDEMLQLIEQLQNRYSTDRRPLVIELSHRVGLLPGFKEKLAQATNANVVELPRGAAAFGALQLWERLEQAPIQTAQGNGRLLIQRLCQDVEPPAYLQQEADASKQKRAMRPTHVLYRDMAYPITAQPLIVGRVDSRNPVDIVIEGQTRGISRKHCSIALQEDEVVLQDFSADGTFVNEARVAGLFPLKLGQAIRVGTPGEKLLLIACVSASEG
jgi:hypothetical protein